MLHTVYRSKGGCIGRVARSDISRTGSRGTPGGDVLRWDMVVLQNSQPLKNGEENSYTQAYPNDTGTKSPHGKRLAFATCASGRKAKSWSKLSFLANGLPCTLRTDVGHDWLYAQHTNGKFGALWYGIEKRTVSEQHAHKSKKQGVRHMCLFASVWAPGIWLGPGILSLISVLNGTWGKGGGKGSSWLWPLQGAVSQDLFPRPVALPVSAALGGMPGHWKRLSEITMKEGAEEEELCRCWSEQ